MLVFLAEIVADDTPAVQAVLKADKKRLALLSEVCNEGKCVKFAPVV